MNFIEELRWRRMLHDVMPGTEELLTKESVKGYIGFDPTSDSLGVGNLVQIMTLLHFQQAGHQPIALVGGATGMVGDPSGKSEERNLLDEDTLQHNIACQKKQLEKFLDFTGKNAAQIVNNYDWFKDFSFLNFIRDVGKYLTVNYMMAKDSVKKRLDRETGEGMSFTEFSYQLVQGYDFYHLWKNHGVKLQMGGSDQWGNITTGTELIRRKGRGEAFALVTPLIKKADGTKFGKTESGNIWLDPAKTSPYQFYQFWLNAADEDVKNYIRIFTLFDENTILDMETKQEAAAHERHLQKALAEDITKRVHDETTLESVKVVSTLLFSNMKSEELIGLNINTFETLGQEIPTFRIGKSLLEQEASILDVLAVHTSILSSKGEAKKAIQNNAISINKLKINSIDMNLTTKELIHNRFIFVENGKKNKNLIIAE